MPLSPEDAAVLRAALLKAHAAVDFRDGYFVLTDAIDELLASLPAEEFAAHLAKYRRPAGQEGPAF